MRKITVTVIEKIRFRCQECGLEIEANNEKEASDIHDRNRPHNAKLKKLSHERGESF